MLANSMTTFFPAKLLLFGEYTVLLDSQALAIPFPKYKGRWSFGKELDERLVVFADYIKQTDEIHQVIDYQLFKKEIKEHLLFESNIPLGYGLGSSGALCAATLAHYGKVEESNIARLKSIFAKLESHFHGTSSGVDPLIAYLQEPLFRDAHGWQMMSNFRLPETKDLQFFLLDTQHARQADTFIQWFTKQCETTTYRQQIEAKVLPIIEALIATINAHSSSNILSLWHELSWLQWQFFQPMIPDFLHSVYLDGLASDWYKLKLCGAGGGGFFLGVTSDVERLKSTVDFPIIMI
ncbi:MAG: hypothetical protein AAGI23_18360 [Bacteroidota bacterium]